MVRAVWFRAGAAGAAIVAAVAVPAASAQAAPAGVAPAVTKVAGDFNAISATSATDAWSVGENPGTSTEQTQILHWNGTHWKTVPSPSPGTGGNELEGVSADSPSDAWAVGYDSAPQSAPTGLLLHWDGTSWTQATMPGSDQTTLAGVAALSPTDAWSVGDDITSTGEQTPLVLHWNGTAWTQLTVPDPTTMGAWLNGVSVLSATDAWAVGQYVHGMYKGGYDYATLILHWNGTSWSQVASPSPCHLAYDAGGTLTAVDAVSTSDAWAVGSCSNTADTTRTLVLRWNGTSWARVASPSGGVSDPFGGNECSLTAVSSDSGSDAWAVGEYVNSHMDWTTLTLHWNGTAWTRVASPSPSNAGGALLFGVAAISGSDAWAAGSSEGDGNDTSLLLHWNGTAWVRG